MKEINIKHLMKYGESETVGFQPNSKEPAVISMFSKRHKSKNSKKNNNNCQKSISDIHTGKKILSAIHNDLLLSESNKDTANPNTPNGRLATRSFMYSAIPDTPNSPGMINRTPNQPEVKLTNTAVNTSINVFDEQNFIDLIIDRYEINVKLEQVLGGQDMKAHK